MNALSSPLQSVKKVLVTGATGFLGRHLLTAFANAPLRGEPSVWPCVLVRDRQQWLAQPWLGEYGHHDVLVGSPVQPETWRLSPELVGVSTIYHLAASIQHSRTNAQAMEEFNVQSTVQMVRLAKDLGARLVLLSTSGTVGCFRFADLAADEHAPYVEEIVGKWPYYASKIRAEREAKQLAGKLGVELVIVRPPSMLGPGDHRGRACKHVVRVLDGKVPFIPSGGMHFVDVRDAAMALTKLVALADPHDIYHLPGASLSLAAFFDMVCEVSGAHLTRRRLPAWLMANAAATGKRVGRWLGTGTPSWIPDPVLVEMSSHFWGLSTLWSDRELGFVSRNPRQTLADTVAWLRTYKTSNNALTAEHA